MSQFEFHYLTIYKYY